MKKKQCCNCEDPRGCHCSCHVDEDWDKFIEEELDKMDGDITILKGDGRIKITAKGQKPLSFWRKLFKR